jgi:hypothetical protein
VTGREVALKWGELLLFVVLLLAALWTAMVLVMRAGWWWWLVKTGPDGQVAAVMFPGLAVIVAAVAFIHDRILRKVGVRPAERAVVTVRKALRGLAVWVGEFLLLLVLAVPWVIFWGFLFIVSGLRARMYGAGEIWVWVMTGAAMILVFVPAFVTQALILRRWRARGKPPETQEGR